MINITLKHVRIGFWGVVFFLLVAGLQLPVIAGERVIPGAVNRIMSGVPVQVDAETMKQCNWFRDGYLYTAFRVELKKGADYTFEFQYPAINYDYGFSFLKANPYKKSTLPPGEQLFWMSKSMQNRYEAGKPNRITKTLFTVNPNSKGNVLYILVSVYVGKDSDPQKSISMILKSPPDPGVDQALVMPGWEELGKLYFYDKSGEITLVE
ncbi:MAG: hypothetical protein ACM3SY_20855 [Candidatus Omnitrophota bacterium]